MKISASINKMTDNPDSATKAYASVTLDGMFAVHGLRVMEGEKGRFVNMPSTSYKDRDGNTQYNDIFHAITKSAREAINQVAIQNALDYTVADTTTDTDTSIKNTSELTLTEDTTTAEISETILNPQVNVLSPEVCEELMEQAQELQETYPDAIGWIYIPDTNINYPIMQGEDNDFYLTHSADGRSLQSGCIELDYRCENRFQNNFNILYGHNMKNGSMFANVCRFKDKAYYDRHPYGWVYTSDAVYRLDFFSVAVTDWHDEIYNGYREVSEWIPRLKEISRIY